MFIETADIKSFIKTSEVQSVHEEIRKLITQSSYPCTAAVKSVMTQDYLIGIYGEFGSGKSWKKLRADLIQFLKTLAITKSRYLSFWAVFNDSETNLSEHQFETRLWQEISLISSTDERTEDWGEENTSDPSDPLFCLSVNGEKLFVVGLHDSSSRKSRQFSKPAMVFNAFSQFRKFQAEGTFDKMVTINRQRDKKFQGSANPMAVAHGEKWESIQFSGRNNSSNWKCPFHFFKNKDKPL